MGCGPSKDGHPANTLLELAPVRTAGIIQPAPNLDRATLKRALENVAIYLNKHNVEITIVAVGGVVNTILLKNRTSTHDIDFYNNVLSQRDYELLKKAIQYAQSHDSILQSEWFNNRTVLFIPKAQREALTQQALSQNEIVFQSQGLKIVAAPWNYAFCAKLDRISGAGIVAQQPYDYTDAAAYINRYLENHRSPSVRQSEVLAWATGFGTTVTDDVLKHLNVVYHTMYHRNAVLMNA